MRPKKIPASFIDPKKSPFGQNFRPKKITRTPSPSLKYVSGAPGIQPLSLCNQVTYCTTAYLNRLSCILLRRIPMLLLFLKLLHRHLKEWGAWVCVSPGQIYENLWVSWVKIILFRSLWVWTVLFLHDHCPECGVYIRKQLPKTPLTE